MDTQNITPLTPQKDRQVSGWLSFFLFVVGLGAAITVVTSIADFSLDAYDIGVGDFFIYLVALIDIVYVLGIGGLALYTILAFLNKRLNAVFLGKSYLIIIFLSNLLLLLGGDYGDYGWGSLPQILKALIFGIVWLVYLCLSEQVSDLFPKEERKILSRDKYIVGQSKCRKIQDMRYYHQILRVLPTIWIRQYQMYRKRNIQGQTILYLFWTGQLVCLMKNQATGIKLS